MSYQQPKSGAPTQNAVFVGGSSVAFKSKSPWLISTHRNKPIANTNKLMPVTNTTLFLISNHN